MLYGNNQTFNSDTVFAAYERLLLHHISKLQVAVDDVVKEVRQQRKLLNQLIQLSTSKESSIEQLPDEIQLPLESVEAVEEVEQRLRSDIAVKRALVRI